MSICDKSRSHILCLWALCDTRTVSVFSPWAFCPLLLPSTLLSLPLSFMYFFFSGKKQRSTSFQPCLVCPSPPIIRPILKSYLSTNISVSLEIFCLMCHFDNELRLPIFPRECTREVFRHKRGLNLLTRRCECQNELLQTCYYSILRLI